MSGIHEVVGTPGDGNAEDNMKRTTLKSLGKVLSLAVGIVVVLGALTAGLSLMNRASTLSLVGGFLLVVVSVWAVAKGVRLWIEW
jgi:hypothetical protein